jgi:hypothetical protein
VQLAVPFTLYHRDDAPADVRAAAAGAYPTPFAIALAGDATDLLQNASFAISQEFLKVVLT